MTYAPGTLIRHYELIRELGRGGMGAVHLARDTRLGRRVAMKFLHSAGAERNARFLLEARATARCSHENIVVIHEADEHDGVPFLVLEYLEGKPLSKWLRKGRTLTPNRALEIITAVVRALERAHAHHIVHRDLKPDNIFLTDSGAIKVLDFGIAKLVQDDSGDPTSPASTDRPSPPSTPWASLLAQLPDDEVSSPSSGSLTRQGALVGTVPYMSPEQWGADTVDHRTDLWAVGILLFRMIAGHHPLAPRRGRQLAITGMLDEPMPRAREACPEMSRAIADIIDRCLVKPKKHRWNSAQEILDALEPLLPGQQRSRIDQGIAPYAGLRAFQEADAARFFGRDREIAAVVARLQSRPLLGVVGPSGVGKSSFVRAGVMPALKRTGESWATLVIRPGRAPLGALAQMVAPMLSRTPIGTGTVTGDLSEYETVYRRLQFEPGFLGVVLRSQARSKGHKVLLFVDQFEELYTLVPDPDARLAFTRCLASAADDTTSPLRVALSIRSDFLDRVSEDENFMTELSQGLVFLTPPGRDGLRDALVQPAQMAGFQFENDVMIGHMLDHLEHVPGALPLLQFAATKLWDLRDQREHLLTDASYRALGGIAGALARHADSVVAELSPARQALVRLLFLALVTPERTRAVVTREEFDGLSDHRRDVQGLIDHLVQARLLVVQTGPGGGAESASVEIVHESLITSWPLLRRWLDENQEDAPFLEELRAAAKQWQAKGYDPGLLWRGEAMEGARRWYHRYRGDLPELQRAFLDAVFSLARRTHRRRRLAVISVAIFLTLMGAAATIALIAIREAKTEATVQADRARVQVERTVRAEKDRLVAESQVDRSREQLAETNEKLRRALLESEKRFALARDAMTQAQEAMKQAEINEKAARRAEAKAEVARKKWRELHAREKRRADRLAAEGGSVIEELPISR